MHDLMPFRCLQSGAKAVIFKYGNIRGKKVFFFLQRSQKVIANRSVDHVKKLLNRLKQLKAISYHQLPINYHNLP